MLVKPEDGIRGCTDHIEKLLEAVVVFALGNSLPHVFLMVIHVR